jgi:predicted nucleotidyltransferase component of viral defense system
MITRAHITRRAAQDNVPAKTVERDYVLAHIIAGLATLESETNMIFKGGTALRLCHFDNYRYSADLDFSLLSGSKEDAYAYITRALENTIESIQGIRLTTDEPPQIAYVGPLGRERKLKLDLADDELVLSTEKQPLLPRWPDLPNDVSVLVYPLLEITGEKLRCVLQRLQCRDLFDLYHLFEEAQVDATEAATVFIPKAKHRKFEPDAFATRYRERLDQYRKRWEAELNEYVVEDVPHFDDVERRVTRHLRRGGLL